MNIKQTREELRAHLVAAREIADAAEKAGRELTGEERETIAKRIQEAGSLKERLAQAESDQEMLKRISDLGAGLGEGPKMTPSGIVVPGRQRKSLGQAFLEDEAYNEWFKHVAPTGELSVKREIKSSPAVMVGGIPGFRKDLITGEDSTSAGAFVNTDYTGIYEPLGRQELTIRDLVSIRQTTSDTVEFVRQTVQVTEAEVVPEANVKEYTGATGEIEGRKPQGKMYFEKVQATVKTIAVWVGATKRALSDAAQIRGIIDHELREDVAEEFEDQIINGTGVGDDFTGLLNTAGTLSQAWDTDIFTTARKAKTALRLLGRSRPTAWVMNPADAEKLDLETDANGRYYYNGPQREGATPLWSYPVIDSETMPEGTAVLGDWRKAVIWDRERTSISVTDSHEDWFVRNMIAILCEMRAAFGVIRPSAFVEVEIQ